MREVLLAAAAIAGTGCFKEPPTVPNDADASTTTASEATSDDPTTTSGGGSETSQGSSGGGTTDVDPTGTGEPPPPPPEGLFKCETAVCEPWTPPVCKQDCGPPNAAGACVLEWLRDRSEGRVDVRACAGECERTAVMVRGGGGDEATRQTATELEGGGFDAYRELKRCELREPAFFAACLVELTPPCVELMQWFVSCADTDQACGT